MGIETGRARARVLRDEDLRLELVEGNGEVALVLAAALNPTMFQDKVKMCEPEDPKSGYVIFVVAESGNAYALSVDTIICHAAELYAATGKKCEVLTALTSKTLAYVR